MNTYIRTITITSLFVFAIVIVGWATPGYAQGDIHGEPNQNLNLLKKEGNLNTGPTMAEFELVPKPNRTNQPSLGSTNFFGTVIPVIFRGLGRTYFDFFVAHKDAAIAKLYLGFSSLQSGTGEGGGGFGLSGDPSGDARLQVLLIFVS